MVTAQQLLAMAKDWLYGVSVVISDSKFHIGNNATENQQRIKPAHGEHTRQSDRFAG